MKLKLQLGVQDWLCITGVWFGLSISFPALAAPLPIAQAEITYLLNHLEQSGCEFYRNGIWYNAKNARTHLDKKNNYLLGKGLINKTEDFIEQAASGSSMSGRPYHVGCTGNPPVPSAKWLMRELIHYRKEQADKR